MRGLSSEEVKQRQDAGLVNDARVKTSRTYSDIIIKNVFTPLNIILFVLGITLFILGRPVSAISATGIITVNILISTIQLGATVDYAILLTTRYKQNRLSGLDKGEAVEKAVSSSAQSILVSGIGFFAATYGVGLYSNVDIISTMCRLIARGALWSVAVVVLLLPAVLLVLDKVIARTTFDMKSVR